MAWSLFMTGAPVLTFLFSFNWKLLTWITTHSLLSQRPLGPTHRKRLSGVSPGYEIRRSLLISAEPSYRSPLAHPGVPSPQLPSSCLLYSSLLFFPSSP